MDPNRSIQMRREALGMSQSEFAEAIGVSVRTLQNWEIGHRTPRMAGMIEQAIRRLEAAHARKVRRAAQEPDTPF
jgi:putative transcriptional regulator